jgi:hypothetical protein
MSDNAFSIISITYSTSSSPECADLCLLSKVERCSQWLELFLRIREARRPAILTDILRGFHQSLQENSMIVPQFRPRPLPSIFSIRRYIILASERAEKVNNTYFSLVRQ